MDSVLSSFVCSLWIINEFEKDKETNDFWWNITWSKIPKGIGEPVGYIASVAEPDLNLGQPRTNPANSQRGGWTRGPPKYKFIALIAVNGQITAWCQTDVSQGLYQSLLLWKTVVSTSFQKPQLHYPLQSSSSLSICSSGFPFSVLFIPSFNVLGGYFSCYHLVWWRQFPVSGCWQISPVTQLSPLSHSWDYVVLFNWMRCTLFSPSIGVKFDLDSLITHHLILICRHRWV